jgi:hypothetical protein
MALTTLRSDACRKLRMCGVNRSDRRLCLRNGRYCVSLDGLASEGNISLISMAAQEKQHGNWRSVFPTVTCDSAPFPSPSPPGQV